MQQTTFYLLTFGLPLVFVWIVYAVRAQRKNRRARKKWEESERSGLNEPTSLHPSINPNICLGCGACVTACPEGDVLGIIKRKAVLISPTACIGHGACRKACPVNAIELVFGTETRGVEIPVLSEDFETNVPGMYIAGELGGMGLIRNAVMQGQQAVDAIAKKLDKSSKAQYDLVIVGAGPSGLSASLAAKDKNLKAITLEQDTVGGAIAHYPRGKVVMTQPANLPLIGKFNFAEASKEQLVEFWDRVLKQASLSIKTRAKVENIEKTRNGFVVTSSAGQFETQKVLLAMGRRGTPRKLGVPGEELSKVVYKLYDPEQYKSSKVLVVGGGDSAIEAAVSISEQAGAQVIISYRGNAFSRAKPKNRERLEAAAKKGRLKILLESNVASISHKHVKIDLPDKTINVDNDIVVVCAGGILPTPFLRKVGIDVEEKFGTA